MNRFTQLRTGGVALKTAITVAAMGSAAAANAALPAWATGIGEDLTTAVTDAAALVGPVVALAIVASIVITLIKRFAAKV